MSNINPLGLDSTSGEMKVFKSGDTINGAAPAGDDTQIQFNDSGSFGGANIAYSESGSTENLSALPDGNNIAVKGADENGTGSSAGRATLQGGSGGNSQEWVGAFVRAGGGSSDDDEGGSVTASGGLGNDTGSGGGVQFSGGSGGATAGSGGSISLIAGSAQGGDSDGGSYTATGGDAKGAGAGGSFTLAGGDADESGTGGGGSFFIRGGAGGGTSGSGASVSIQGGDAQGGDSDGGSMYFQSGQGAGAGVNGSIFFNSVGILQLTSNSKTNGYGFKLDSVNEGDGPFAYLETSSLASSDKTFTFPNWNGTFIVKTDSKSLTGQTADITTTNFTNGGVGQYQLNYVLIASSADLTAGAIQATFAWVDDAGSTSATSASLILTALGRTSGTINLQRASGNITYAVAHTGIFGTATYSLYVTLIKSS